MEVKSLKLFEIFILVSVCINTIQGSPKPDAGNDALTPVDAEADLSGVHFYLWTPTNPGDTQHYELINGDIASLNGSPFNPAMTTYFMIHAYLDNGLTGWILKAKTNILALGPSNVISVDWSQLADVAVYSVAVKNMYEVAAYVGGFIDFLVINGSAQTSNIEIAGHSLGAHCSGLAAQAVTTGTISRVTGLDPAGPDFYEVTPDQRLDKSQADFVDVIHTNGGLCAGCYGIFKEIGHVDFYPNGGQHQPGCLLDVDGCSHDHSHAFWIESILAGFGGTDLTFVSWPCDSWATYAAGGCPNCGQGCLDMGFHVDRSLTGPYYLTTEKRSPYAKGDVQV